MTARDDAIEAGARALMEIDPISWTRARVNAAAVVDAVEPIIRADEHECFCAAAHVEAEVRERLRAEAMNLPSRVELDEVGNEVTWVRYADVCDLLGGESDG